MKKLLSAIALSIAIPAVAQAQAAPAPAPAKTDCQEKMKAEGMDCCKGMHDKMHGKDGHDMKSMEHKGEQPKAEQHKH